MGSLTSERRSAALDISLRDFRTASLEPGDYENDETVDRSVLVVAVGVVGGGMAFLLSVLFLLFPEWIRPIAFGTTPSAPRVLAVFLRPDAAAHNGWAQGTPFHQAQARNLMIDQPGRSQDTAQTPSANQTLRVTLPPRGQSSAQATLSSSGRTFQRVADNTPRQPAVQPPAGAWAVPVPNNGTRSQQRQSNVASLGVAAARHASGKKPV